MKRLICWMFGHFERYHHPQQSICYCKVDCVLRKPYVLGSAGRS